MADDMHARIPTGNGGEHLELKLGTRSFGVTSRDLISVLLVLVMGVGFYLTVKSVTDNQERGFKGQQVGFDKLEKLLELTHTNQTAMLGALRDNREVTGGLLREQNELLRLHTEQLTKNQSSIVERIHTQTEHIRQWLAMVLFKLEHPDQPVSLDLPGTPQERGR